jgi:hypothetical protein
VQPINIVEGLKLARDMVRDAIVEALAAPREPEFVLRGAGPVLTESMYADEVPTQWQFCCKWSSQRVMPVDFISYPTFVGSSSSFPPGTAFLPAGSTSNIAYHSVRCGLYKIRCGAGPDARDVFCDLKPGRFSLGPQNYVEVFATLWGTAALVPSGFPSIQVASAIGPSDGSGDYIPYSAHVVLGAGSSVGPFTVGAAGKQFMDIGVQSATVGVSTFAVRTTSGSPIERDYANRVFNPALGVPVPVVSGALTFENFGASALTSTFPGFIRYWCST